MRAVLVHDHVFTVGEDGTVWSRGAFPASVWDRYLRHFDKLTVVARRSGDPSTEGLSKSSREGVEFVFAPSLSGLRGLIDPGPGRRVIAEAFKGADAAIVRVPSELGFAALPLARKMGVPAAVEVVGCAWDSYFHHGAASARAYAPLAFLRMRRAVASAPFAIYVTERFLQGRYPNAGHTSFASNVLLTEVSAEPASPAPHEGFVLGTVASLQHRYKGVQTAFEALRRLGRKDVRYRVLGPGDTAPWEALARKLGVADQVEFSGRLPAGEAVLRWIDDLDLYLQPSFQEGLPRALIEAMSRGKAAVGSSAGGIPELLDPAMIHRPGDAGALAERISRLLDDEAERRRQAKRNLEIARRYLFDELEKRRSAFWAEFRDYAARA